MLSYAGYHRHRHFAGEAAAVVAAEERADRAVAKETARKEYMETAKALLVHKAAAVGAAGLAGAWQGYYGKMAEVPYTGIGVDLALGFGLSVVGVAGHAMPSMKNKKMLLEAIDGVGTGLLSFWVANQANMYGIKKSSMKAPAAAAPAAATSKGYEGASPREFAPHYDPSYSDAGNESSVPYGYR